MVEPIDELASFAHEVFDAQPFSKFVGARLLAVGPGQAEIGLDIQRQHKQQDGYVHGGVISYLADNAITFAGGLALGGNALTSEFKINYLRPARGEALVARATTKNAGRRQAICLCEVFGVSDGREELCALALGTVVGMGPPNTGS